MVRQADYVYGVVPERGEYGFESQPANDDPAVLLRQGGQTERCRNPGRLPRQQSVAGAASSFVYRVFNADTPFTLPQPAQRAAFAKAFPDGMLLEFPKPRGSMARDFKWLGSYRYAIIHLGGADKTDLRRRCEQASAIFGWSPPYLGATAEPIAAPHHPILAPTLSLETTP